jgi:hypothetical protein
MCLLGLLSVGGGAARAQAPLRYSAAEVKAAYLYNFSSFVTWPEGAGPHNEVIIGVLGAEEVELHLRRIPLGQTAQTRPISVRRVDSAKDTAGVHILFIGASQSDRLGRILELMQNQPVLTVTEVPDGLERGSVINLVTTDRVQIEVSLAAAAKARLQLNSRLLGVALRIKKGEKGNPLYAHRRCRCVTA